MGLIIDLIKGLYKITKFIILLITKGFKCLFSEINKAKSLYKLRKSIYRRSDRNSKAHYKEELV